MISEPHQKPFPLQELYQVNTNYLCAGIILQGEMIVETAPILKWMKGRTLDQVMAHCPPHYKFKRIIQ